MTQTNQNGLTESEQNLCDEMVGLGNRYSEDREAVCTSLIVLSRNGGHPTVEEICSDAFGPKANTATTYRTMTLLEENNYVRRHEFDTGRKCYEVNMQSHIHFVSTTDGTIQEIPLSSELETLLNKMALQKGLSASKLSITIYGEGSAVGKIEN